MNKSMPRFVIAILTVLLLVYGSSAAASSSLLQDLVRTDIASGHETKCALRDKYGFLWIGTTLGVKCYDSNGTPVYDNGRNALLPMANLSITSLCECGDDIYIGTNDGLYVFSRAQNSVNKFDVKTRYRVEISSQVEKIVLVGQKYLWVCTEGQGVFVYDIHDKTLLQDSRYGSFLSDLAVGLNGLVYTSSLAGDILAFGPKGNYVKTIKIPDYAGRKSSILMAVSNRDIWISTGLSFYRLNVTTDEIHCLGTRGYADNINALLARPDGTLLIGTNSGLWSYNTISDNYRHIISADNVSDDYDVRVVGLSADPGGEVIVIHPSGPIDVLSAQVQLMNFYSLPTDNATGYNQIKALQVDKDSKGFWAGTDNGLYYFDLARADLESGVQVSEFKEMSINALKLVDDKLWIATNLYGVFVYDTKSGRRVQNYLMDESKPYSILSNKINNIYVASDGVMYFLTDWGICYYNQSDDNFLPLTEFSQHTRATAMQEDHRGGQWIATLNNGLYYRERPTEKFRKADWCRNIVSLPIVNLYRDSADRLWAVTKNQGLFILNENLNDFTPIDLPLSAEKNVAFIIEDTNHKIWAGVNNMLVEIDDKLASRIYHFVHYPDMMPAVSISDAGRAFILIGSRNGFYTFDTGKVYNYNNSVKVLPKSISFPNIRVDEKVINDYDLNALLYTRKSIELPYDYNTFGISLSSIHPYAEPNIQFDYFLEGLDKAWHVGSYNSEIGYSNISFGDYRLLMKPHGLDGVAPTELAITILPPWYLTRWAIVTYAVVLLIVCYVAFVVVRRMLRKNMQRRVSELRIQTERELFEAKTRYFVDLVHEIRTPLMLISLPLEQLTEAMKADAQHVAESKNMDYIRSMQHNIDYLLGITNQLLDFRKVENNSEVKLNIVSFNVSQSLRNICRRFDEPLRISNIEITTDIPDEDIYIAVDADKIERILMNLVGNAMKYAAHRISLHLALVGDGSDVLISVGDDGPGVPVKEREKIFDTYYQIGNDNVAASLGTGLGLAYSKLVAEAHKGHVAAGESEFGGALFSLTLPMGDVKHVEPIEILTESEPLDMAESDILLKQDKTVLLVEDNKELRDMISAALRGYCKVLTAVDGLKALDVLAANNVDVIVSDVMMPRMDGVELCRKVKSDVYYSQILFLILTAKTGTEAHEIGMKSGADVYLEKPFSVKQLIYQINNLLRTRQNFYELVRNSMSTSIPTGTESKPVLNRMDSDFLKRMNDFISESIRNEDFSIDTLAEKMNMSRSSFYRKITVVVGMSPSEYLKHFRLTRAAELLVDGCRVSEVSDRVGFASSSYFAKCFKEKFGVLPSDYVDSLPSAGANASAGQAEDGQ